MFNIRLKNLRKQANMSQKALADMLFVSQAAVAKWELDKTTPTPEMLVKIAKVFDVPVDFLLGYDSQPQHGVKIPVLGRVQAGIPIEAVEEILDWEEITPEMAATGEHFALRVRGQSMEPKFSEGDIIIVRQQQDVDSGDIAVVLVNGYEATVKLIKKSKDGVALIPTNPAFDTMFYTNQEIIDLPVQVIGKVVELRAKF